MSDISAHDLHAAYVKACVSLGMVPVAWEQLSEEQRTGLAELARQYTEKMKELDHQERRLQLLKEELFLEGGD